MVFGNLGRMLAAAAGERDGSILAAVFESGCGGSQPPLSATMATGRVNTETAKILGKLRISLRAIEFDLNRYFRVMLVPSATVPFRRACRRCTGNRHRSLLGE